MVQGPENAVGIGAASLVVIAGPCALESWDTVARVADALRVRCRALQLPLVFKGSFDKANRTSRSSYRGPGIDRGLELLARVRREFAVPVTTDVHLPGQVEAVAEVVDLLQIPAFLCRQTDLLEAARASGRPVNVKKGQFLSASECAPLLDKLDAAVLTERGTFFGYHDLVVDLRNLRRMRALGAPVVYDATHSLQRPGAGIQTGGERDHIPALARAAVAAGVDGVFLEVHPDPASAGSDSATQLDIPTATALLGTLARIRNALAE